LQPQLTSFTLMPITVWTKALQYIRHCWRLILTTANEAGYIKS